MALLSNKFKISNLIGRTQFSGIRTTHCMHCHQTSLSSFPSLGVWCARLWIIIHVYSPKNLTIRYFFSIFFDFFSIALSVRSCWRDFNIRSLVCLTVSGRSSCHRYNIGKGSTNYTRIHRRIYGIPLREASLCLVSGASLFSSSQFEHLPSPCICLP